MKYMYALLLILAGSPVLASVYLKNDAVDEAVRRGATELFTRSVGRLDIESNKGDIVGNAVLVAKDTILTSKHLLKDKHVTSAAVIFYPDIVEYNTFVSTVIGSGKHPADVPFTGKYMDPKYPKTIQDIAAKLDLERIVFHPTLDLALVKLNRPLAGIPVMPLLWTLPDGPLTNGYMVSYSSSCVLLKAGEASLGKRHISIINPHEIGAEEDTLWVKNWTLKGEMEVGNKDFIPESDAHRLLAYPQPSDSGAPFIVKNGKVFVVAGIYCGRILTDLSAASSSATGSGSSSVSAAAGGAGGAAAGMSGGAATDGPTHKVTTIIFPLYPVKAWLEANI